MALFSKKLAALPLGLRSVVEGYAQGYFLMADENTGHLDWYQANTHTLLPLDDRLHIPKSMRRVLNQNRFHYRISQAVPAVISGCANRVPTWISEELIKTYLGLARFGIVHTFEAWQGDQLAGGVLGVHLGGAFIGESMFTAIEDGGKAALVGLCQYLRENGFLLFDGQLTNPHLARFGSYEIPLDIYQTMLAKALTMDCQMERSPVLLDGQPETQP